MITLTNPSGASVTLTERGAGIVAVNVPDRKNNLGNVIADYIPCDPDVIWSHRLIADDEVMFCIDSLRHKSGECRVSYRWTANNVLEIYYQDGIFVPGAKDILGQSYFNLGAGHEPVAKESLWINSPQHPDFSNATKLCDRLVNNVVFDHSWHLREWIPDVMDDAALLASPVTGRQISIHTSLPVLGVSIPASRKGISFSTLPTSVHTAIQSQQTTFLHFSVF